MAVSGGLASRRGAHVEHPLAGLRRDHRLNEEADEQDSIMMSSMKKEREALAAKLKRLKQQVQRQQQRAQQRRQHEQRQRQRQQRLARAQDDSKPDLYDHPLAPEHVLLRAPAVPPRTKA